MSTNILGSLPVRFLLLFLLPLLSQSVSVYVANNDTDSPNCLQGSPNNSCKTLTLALEYIHDKNDSIVYIENGVYDLIPSSLTLFQSVRNITIAGEGTVEITCNHEVNAGLTFLRSSDIHIHGIRFSGCGVVHNSTSRDFNNKIALNMLTFNATLYFEGCVNVTLDSVHITESLGIAVQFYTTTGTNMIINSNFSNNPKRIRAGQVIGGGVYIEFPYCQPGDTSCNNDASSVDINTISNSQYIINDNVFSNNDAKSTKEQAIRFVLPYKTYHDAFGRGGGLSIFFKGNAANNAFSIANCTFENNRAVYGGGLYVEMQDNSYNNSVKLYNHNVFIDNLADEAGGGMLVSYLFLQELNHGEINSSSVILEDVSFNGNTAGSGNGGGLSYSSTRQMNLDILLANTLSLTNCEWISNTARTGSALDIRAFHPVTIGSFPAVPIINSSFYNNSVIYTSELGQPLGTGAMYIDNIPIEFSGFVIFENNYDGTALTAFHASMDFLEYTTTKFQNNTGHNGGAIALYASSFIKIWPFTKFLFAENSVTNLGGAIYVEYIGAEAQITAQNCFFRYYNYTTNPKKWKTQLNFSKNVGGNSNNSIYSSSIYPCLWGRSFGDVSQSLVDEVFCWNTEDEIHWDYGPNTTNETCKSQILTDVSSFSESSLPRYLNVIPGKLTPMNITGINEQGENVTQNLILHAYSNSQGVSVHKDYQYISSNNIVLYKTGENDNVTVIIDTIDQQTTLQTHLVVQFQECPPGFILENGKCICSGTFDGFLKCHQSTLTAELLRGFWIGPSPIDNTTVVAHCQYCSYNFKSGYLIMNESFEQVQQTICTSTGEGPLCSICTEGYAPAINIDNYKCVRCSSVIPGVSIFILIDIILPIGFLIILYVVGVPLTNGLFHGPIFFAQMITTVISLDADDIISYGDLPGFNPSGPEVFEKIYTTLYDIFNLEFFMFTQNYCFSHNIRYATIVAIHYISALIPAIFVLIAWCIYYKDKKNPKFIRSCFKNFNTANMLATLILLSYTKLAVITGYLLTYVSLIPASGDISHSNKVMYLDGSVIYMSPDYTPYLIIALSVTIFVLIPIPLFLMCFRSDDPENNAGFLNHLLDQFQHDFKNGPADFQLKSLQINNGHSDMDNPCHGTTRCNMCCEERAGSGSWCDPYCCCFRIDNKISYEYTCCTPTELYSYRQMKSRYCRSVYTSWSFYDFRWLSGGFFVLRILLLLPYIAHTTIIRNALQFVICIISGMLIMIIKPYKQDANQYVDPNVVEASSLFLLALIITMTMYQYFYTVNSAPLSTWAYVFQSIAVLLPLVWISGAYICLMVKKFCEYCKKPKKNDDEDGISLNFETQRLMNPEGTELRQNA